MRKKRSSEKGPEPEQTPVMAAEPNRRPSRRAAVEAAKKIYNTAHNYDMKDTNETPPEISSESKSKKRREDISLEMHCEDEVLSPVQNRFQREAIEFYNLTMRNLRQLQACSNVRIIEERPNQANVRKTPSAKTKSMPLSKALMLNVVKNKKNAQNGVTQIIYV